MSALLSMLTGTAKERVDRASDGSKLTSEPVSKRGSSETSEQWLDRISSIQIASNPSQVQEVQAREERKAKMREGQEKFRSKTRASKMVGFMSATSRMNTASITPALRNYRAKSTAEETESTMSAATKQTSTLQNLFKKAMAPRSAPAATSTISTTSASSTIPIIPTVDAVKAPAAVEDQHDDLLEEMEELVEEAMAQQSAMLERTACISAPLSATTRMVAPIRNGGGGLRRRRRSFTARVESDEDDDEDEDEDGIEEANTDLNRELQTLLSDLRVEPTDPKEVEDKFKIYTQLQETVSIARESCESFFQENKDEFEHHQETASRIMKGLDKGGGIYDETREWFVYSMVQQAYKNNINIIKILTKLQKLLEAINDESNLDCPICLECVSKDQKHILSCAHATCKDCWNHWKTIRGQEVQSVTCPLCRNEEFLSEVLQLQSIHSRRRRPII